MAFHVGLILSFVFSLVRMLSSIWIDSYALLLRDRRVDFDRHSYFSTFAIFNIECLEFYVTSGHSASGSN